MKLERKLLATAIAGLLISEVAFADTPATQFKKMKISVARGDANIEEVNRSLIVKTQEKINQIQAESTAEALAFEPNVEIAGGPRSGNQTINIRGLEGNRILQTIDGVRQNFESGHRPTYFLDPVLLKQVEVLKGPSSSLWGSGALGGVVAQQTINAGDILDTDARVGGLIKHAFNENGNGHATTLAAGFRGDNYDLLASAYYRDKDDFEQGNGEELANSADRNHGVLLKGEFQIDDSQSLTINIRDAKTNGAVPSNGSAEISRSNFLIDRSSESSQYSLDYRLNTHSPLINAQALVYRNDINTNESRISDGRSDSTELETLGLNVNNQSEFGNTRLTYGIDYFEDDFSSERGGTDRPIPPEATTDVTGYFVKADIQLTDSLQSDIGIRHDNFETEAENLNSSRKESATSFSGGIAWAAAEWLQLGLRFDEAFRAPSSQELYTTGTHFCMGPGFCNTFVSNPDLEPEEAENKEVLANMEWASVWKDGDALNIKTSVFQNDVDNFIEQFVTPPNFSSFPPDAGISSWTNVDEAKIKGFEIQASYQHNALSVVVGYGETEGEDTNTGNALSSIPANKFSSDINYVFIPERVNAGVRYTYAAEQNDVPPDNVQASYNSYHLVDVYASWKPKATGDNLTFDVTINNLTDRHYHVAFQELFEPGREVRLSASYTF